MSGGRRELEDDREEGRKSAITTGGNKREINDE